MKKQGVECIEAPHYSGAQLGFLSGIEYIDAIFTQDYEQLAYGGKLVSSFFGWLESKGFVDCI
jgi:hypothetical protein